MGLEGGPFVPVCGHYDDAWPPSGSIMGLEGGLLSRYAAIMATTMLRNMHIVFASTNRYNDDNKIDMVDRMLPKELRSVATQLEPIQEVADSKSTWCKCWSGLRRLFQHPLAQTSGAQLYHRRVFHSVVVASL